MRELIYYKSLILTVLPYGSEVSKISSADTAGFMEIYYAKSSVHCELVIISASDLIMRCVSFLTIDVGSAISFGRRRMFRRDLYLMRKSTIITTKLKKALSSVGVKAMMDPIVGLVMTN